MVYPGVSKATATIIHNSFLNCRPVGSNSVVSKSHVTIQSCGFSTKRNPVGSTKVSVASEREHVASKRKFGATESDAYTRESDTEESAEREDGASKKESSTEQSGACTRKFDTKDSDLILPNCIQCEFLFTIHKMSFWCNYSRSIPNSARI